MAAAARGGKVEAPLALLVNQPLSSALKNVSLFFMNPACLPSFYFTPKYKFFYSFSLNSYPGYTQLGRHY